MHEIMEEQALGRLPQYAPLANPYVPFQQRGAATYPAKKGIVRGTLYPGLDLPFLGYENNGELGSKPLEELQALSFAIVELGEYLDTHPEDSESLALFRRYVSLYEEGKSRYEQTCGPLTQRCAGENGAYNGLKGPWPWEACAREG